LSLPPIRRDSFETKVNPPEAKMEEGKVEAPDLFQKAEQAILKAVDLSMTNRREKLQTLPPEISIKFDTLEKDFAKLRELCFEVCLLNSKSKELDAALDELPSDDENESIVRQREELEAQIEALEDPIEEAEKNMKTFIQQLSGENHVLGVMPEFFSDWWQLGRIDGHKQELSLKFMEEQLLNRCLNQVCFLNGIQTIVEEKKAEIIGTFYPGDPASLDLKQVSFKLFPHGSETHNRGKVPVKIVFTLGEVELFSIFFKPRDAQVDANVIQIFHDLNALSLEEKSSNIDLPTYTIINMVYGNQYLSFWEFIEGRHLHGHSADEAIQGLPSSPEEKKSLNNQLLRLQSVCKFLNISDLHLENLIFTHLGEGNAQVIPIDLESIQPGNATGLFAIEPAFPPFTETEIALLEKGKASIGKVPVRFVPIPTSHFLAGLTRCDSFISMARFVNQSIQRKNYTPCIQQAELEWLVLNDFLHNDVPYLTEYQSQIYYGSIDEGNVIARRL